MHPAAPAAAACKTVNNVVASVRIPSFSNTAHARNPAYVAGILIVILPIGVEGDSSRTREIMRRALERVESYELE